MKAKILSLLRERGDYVSGQELCKHFGVSRTAVWKAIGQLKKEGYQIEAVQNKGYLLTVVEEEDVFNGHEIESRMGSGAMGNPLYFFDCIDSTNLKAKQMAETGATEGTLFIADQQTAGRGRRGRSWDSPKGKNVYFTLLLRPQIMPNKASMLTLVMAMAVAEGIKKAGLERAGIKWPNDIVVDGKKVCGILTEMSLCVETGSVQYVVIGVGINVGNQSFPEDIAATATSLQDACGKPIQRSRLIVDIMEAFEGYYKSFLEKEDLSLLADAYNHILVNQDRQVRVLDPKGEFDGVAKGINDTGELLVELASGEVVPVYAGEVSVRGIYGYV